MTPFLYGLALGILLGGFLGIAIMHAIDKAALSIVRDIRRWRRNGW